jgi:hypothetical protein
MIKVPFDCRTAAVRLETEREASTESSLSAQEHEEDMLLAQELWAPDYTARTVERKSASNEIFNITLDWSGKVKAVFDSMNAVIVRGDRNDQGADILQQETNLIFKLPLVRLDQHIIDRVPEVRRKHWVWQFVRKNLSRVAAVMILFDHVVHDLERFATNPNKCLLRNASSLEGSSFIPLVMGTSDTLTEAAKKTEDCYLSFDPEEAVWIRSGNVCGRSLSIR